MGGLFNWRTIVRGVLGLVGTWLISMPCVTPEDTCLTRVIGTFLIGLGMAIGSSAASVKAVKGGSIP